MVLAFLPWLVFAALLLLLITWRGLGWRAAWLGTVLIWWTGLVAMTEVLGAVHALSRAWIAAGWGVFLLVTLVVLWRSQSWRQLRQRLSGFSLSPWERWLAAGGAVYLLISWVVAWMAPPNTNDSLTYHMPRVMHWLQDRSLTHYFTVIDRQIWNPPGAEYAILHFQSLAGNDRFANLVQWFALLGILAGVSLAAARLGAGRKGQWFAAIFALTLPMGILQATSTQNDLVTALWVVCLLNSALLAAERPLTWMEWLETGLAVGLGILTKGTFYAFAAPFLVWLLIVTWKRAGTVRVMKAAGIGIALILMINAGTWIRNLEDYHSPLGPANAVSSLANERLSPGGVLSIAVRNAASQMAFPLGALNRLETAGVEKFLGWFNQDVNDPLTSLSSFSLKFAPQSEDFAANPLHFLWIWAAVILLIFTRNKECRSLRLSFAAAVLSIFVLFSVLYKWQPWGSRLLLPFFIAGAPLAIAAIEGLRPSWLGWGMVALLWVAGLPSLLVNNARPVLPLSASHTSVLTASRQELLFVNSPENRDAYVELSRWVKVAHCQNLALILKSEDPEYPLWTLLSPDAREVRIEHVNPNDFLSAPALAEFSPCSIFVSVYDFNDQNLPDFQLVESRLGFRLYLTQDLMKFVR